MREVISLNGSSWVLVFCFVVFIVVVVVPLVILDALLMLTRSRQLVRLVARSPIRAGRYALIIKGLEPVDIVTE